MSNLWVVNSQGRVFTLSTSGDHWQEILGDGLDFKKVSANEFFTWAIGGDHQIYIYVPTKDVPIRCRVVTYENERWNPVHGFSSKLLPTDRPHWSSANGLESLTQESFLLPSKSWEWEEEWYVEDNLEGQPLEPEGWTYAVDFPTKYGPNKTWNSLVRRRKWIRYRRFCRTNVWSLIPSINEDPILDPFIDVCVGGTEVPGGEQDKFAVWAVTINAKVVFRYGVSMISPEGQGWVPIATPEQCEVSQISVGPSGLVWAVTWGGDALVRTGVTRENMMGTNWVIVSAPGDGEKLTQISIGVNSIWAVTKDKKVWFRKGISGLHSGENEGSAVGSGWIEMYGHLSMVNIGINDQVFSIGSNGRSILLRTGVDSLELCGKTWKQIQCTTDNARQTSSLSSSDSQLNMTHRHSSSPGDTCSLGSATPNSRKISSDSAISSPACDNKSVSSENLNDPSSRKLSSISLCVDSGVGRLKFDSISNRTSSYSSLDGGSYNADLNNIVWQTDGDPAGYENMWIWTSGTGCLIDSESLPHWFSERGSTTYIGVDEPWYEEIVSLFNQRSDKEMKPFSSYAKAVDKSTWVKTGTCRWYLDCNWLGCLLELVQEGEYGGSRGFITCHHKTNKVVTEINDVTCVLSLCDFNKAILAVHTAKMTLKGTPLKLSFTSFDDLEDWLATLNTSCRNINHLSWIPEKTAAWLITVNGDVYIHNGSSQMESQHPSTMQWSLLGGGHLRQVETCPAGITWGLGYDCTAWVYTKGHGGGPYRGIPGSNTSVSPMSDSSCLFIYENQRWNPLTGFTAKGLPTDRYMWSDQTGRVECTKENTHLPSGHWQWTSDWCVDYKTPKGVDNEGWQYATDFPRSYHGYKRFTDYVRRRRWYRKCKLTTSGPWKQLGTTKLLDVSFQVDPCSKSDTISVWAVAINGDVLCRVGVTESCPTGTTWTHIPAEKKFRSISVGGEGAVWAVANDGSAQLRHGISVTAPTGLYWCHVEPPQVGCPLLQISAGKTSVLTVDEDNRLWSRQEIVSVYKEGTHWKMVDEEVKHVSVGPVDQIWCIKKSFETSSGIISNALCRRSGICEGNKCGTDFQLGIGGYWNYISIRGCLFSEE